MTNTHQVSTSNSIKVCWKYLQVPKLRNINSWTEQFTANIKFDFLNTFFLDFFIHKHFERRTKIYNNKILMASVCMFVCCSYKESNCLYLCALEIRILSIFVLFSMQCSIFSFRFVGNRHFETNPTTTTTPKCDRCKHGAKHCNNHPNTISPSAISHMMREWKRQSQQQLWTRREREQKYELEHINTQQSVKVNQRTQMHTSK